LQLFAPQVLDLQRALHADPATSGGRGTFGSDTLDLSDIAGKVSLKNHALASTRFFHLSLYGAVANRICLCVAPE